MKFLPVLSGLFSSDSIIFMIIGFVIAVIISMKISDKRKGFVGTVALGLCLGFLIGTVLLKGKYL